MMKQRLDARHGMANAKHSVTIADLREMARRRLPEFAFVPMETGSGDGSGPRRNQLAFRDVHLSARALVDVSDPQQGVSLFGRRYASPFGISAIGYAGMLRRGADEMLAEAAVEADIPFMLSGGATASVETIARIAPDHVWQQLYPARDVAITEDILRRARDAGVNVLVYTVDSPVPPRNDWLARSGIRLPAHVPTRAWPYVVWQVLTHPAWALDHGRRGGLPRLEGWTAYAPAGAGASQIAGLFQKNVPNVQTWTMLERIRALWPGILVIKGIVHPADARRALDMGANAITVSNHGGNKLDSMPGAIDVLPGVSRAVPEETPLFFDGGVRKGSDIVAALALGADFCFLGRAPLYGVIADGVRGARRAIDIIRDDITRTLALIGCPDVATLSDDFIHRRQD
jgi:(S)-mandelate dehydrogenase